MIWTLRKKILIGYSIVLILMIVIFAWAFINLLNLGQASDAILRENYRSILAADEMIGAIERQDSAILLVILGYEYESVKQFRENESVFLQWFARAKDNITVEGEAEVIKAIDTGYSSYLINFSELKQFHQFDPQKAAAFYHETVLPSFKSVRDRCVYLREINQEAMSKASEYARSIARRAIWSMVAVGIIAIGIGLGFSLLLSNLLVRPLRQIMETVKKVAEGNYDVEVPVISSDERRLLSDELNTMIRKLRTYHELNIEQIVAEKQKSDAIIRSVDDGIVVVDSKFRITNMNPTAAKVFGVESDRAKGEHFLEVVKNEQLFNYVEQSVESGQPSLIEEDSNILTVKKGEMLHHYMFSVVPVYAKPGAMLGVVLLLRDVTKLKELDRLKSEFVLMASHELRTPITSIGMSIDLLQETVMQKLNEKEQQLLLAAHEEMQRIKALINDLLDFSRIEAGKIDMEFDRVPILTLFEKSVAVLKPQADEKSIELSYEFPKEQINVKADPNKIIWVLTNLISNALRYTDSGGHIRLFTERVGSQAHVSVSDDGEGIPYEYQSRIFDKFVQVKGSKSEGGSGLGLTICKEIVRAHGGTIWVDSTPGEGSTFTFTLPVIE